MKSAQERPHSLLNSSSRLPSDAHAQTATRVLAKIPNRSSRYSADPHRDVKFADGVPTSRLRTQSSITRPRARCGVSKLHPRRLH
jgi:hypothetical protein